ncbi:MAG: hypothetical protein M1840_007719 [Geoglossum simile]|nr:MAG: hypothetical protein M1840_007719 [Geoglossum simile]
MRAEEDQATLDYSSWKRLLRPPFRNDEWSSEDVWVGALDILNGTDRNLKQRLAKDITDDGYAGLQYVKQVMTADFASGFSFGIEFATHVVPFLLTISHRSLLESMAVDTYVGDLYQFVCGSNGERAIPFFNRVGERLFSEAQSPYFVARSECVPFAKALVATSIALRETVRRSQRAAFGNNLPDIINRLRDTIQPSGLTDQSPDYHVVRTCLDELSGLVRRARGLLVESDDLSSGTENLTITRAASNFRDLDLPGNRHDNDFLDIAKIAILPTFAEIKSDRPEFLPYKDKNMPHFLHGTDRLVDTHFRLLRHDVFGAMKDTIGGLLNSLGAQPDSGGAVKLYVGNNQRCHIYEQAHIARLSYERRRGLEIQISFLQPWQIRKEPKSARMKWWKERKRLEEGSLLCLISSTEGKESALLLVVSKKDTDQNQKFGLASEGSHAQITVRLARDGIGNDLEYLAEWYHRRQSLQQILIEFPDTIPATFLPILKNLQEMHRLGHIPFRRWIVPDAEGSIDPTTAHGADPQGIPPPAYTLRPHFVFDLRKICKTVHSQYTVSPRTPTNDQTTLAGLKQNTSLDDGQCRALLTALTQEFALIQGPPGTGKSYVGVQLMRVLVDNKEKGDLGPVVVV